jgi:hypothetical protein
MKIQGYDAEHFLNQAIVMTDEVDEIDLCPDEASRRERLQAAQVEATVGLALAILTAIEDA